MTDIIGPSNKENNRSKPASQGSSTFVEIFVAPEPKRRNSLLLHIVKTSIEDSFKNSGLATNFDSLKPDEFITSNQLDPSKLNVNHAKLPEEI